MSTLLSEPLQLVLEGAGELLNVQHRVLPNRVDGIVPELQHLLELGGVWVVDYPQLRPHLLRHERAGVRPLHLQLPDLHHGAVLPDMRPWLLRLHLPALPLQLQHLSECHQLPGLCNWVLLDLLPHLQQMPRQQLRGLRIHIGTVFPMQPFFLLVRVQPVQPHLGPNHRLHQLQGDRQPDRVQEVFFWILLGGW